MSAPVIPPGGSWLDTLKKSFVDVHVDAANDNAIATTDFLDAAESLTTLFGMQEFSTITIGLTLSFNRCSWLRCLHSSEKRHPWKCQGKQIPSLLDQAISSYVLLYRKSRNARSPPLPSPRHCRIW